MIQDFSTQVHVDILSMAARKLENCIMHWCNSNINSCIFLDSVNEDEKLAQ